MLPYVLVLLFATLARGSEGLEPAHQFINPEDAVIVEAAHDIQRRGTDSSPDTDAEADPDDGIYREPPDEYTQKFTDSVNSKQLPMPWMLEEPYSIGDNTISPPCVTAGGRPGQCTSFRKCYPYFKLPQVGGWEGWVFGHYDTCSYPSDGGREAFGVCCTNPLPAQLPATNGDNGPVIEAAVAEIPAYPFNSVSNYNPLYPFGNWPPPIPTHPPNHTPATHPPMYPVNHPTKPVTNRPITNKPITQKPITATKPTTSKWPPPLPTHPPSRPATTMPPTAHPTHPPVQPVISDPSACGIKNGYQDQERILGGHNADQNEWPWAAVLFNNGRQFCGGSLIDNMHVISAAHCVAHMTSWDVARITVRLGDHNIRTNSEVQHIEKRVKRVVRHRGFDMRTLYNDVSVLTLDSPVQFSSTVRPICLPSSGKQYSGQTATVVGWGSLRENGPQPSVLQEVSIPIWTNAECRQKYGPAAPGGIVEHMLCAGRASKDSCSGDSGGPLMVNEGGRWTQVGIVSWGIGCGKGNYPGVYTRVTHFLPWIQKNAA